jgi:predicted dehydrogenase
VDKFALPGSRVATVKEMTMSGINRRSFLKRTAIAAAVPTIISSRAFGANSKVNLGFIGVGGRGSALLNGALWTEGVQVVAVSDCFASRRARAMKTVSDFYAERNVKSDCKEYADFREVLSRDDIDGVVIATADHWHVPLSIYAIKAGKDVYVEKPLGVSVDYGFKLRKLVQDKGAVLQYGTQQRSDVYFRLACELTRAGYLGKLKSIDAWCAGMRAPGQYAQVFKDFHPPIPTADPPADLDYERWIGPAKMSPYTKNRVTEWGGYHVYDYALGFIAGWGAHPLDIAQWGNNSDEKAPIHYEGTGTIPGPGLFDTVAEWDVRCKYANGVDLHFMDTISAEKPVRGYFPGMQDHGTTFHGEDGWVTVRRGSIDFSDEALRRIKPKDDERMYESKSHMGNFVECIKSRKKPISPIEAAVQSDLISHLSNACIRTGRAITWDPKKEKIVGDREAAKTLSRKQRAPWKV